LVYSKRALRCGGKSAWCGQARIREETGCRPVGDFIALGEFKQPGGKVISAWAFEGDFDLTAFRSNLFSIEWPPGSGRRTEFPEADRAGWFVPAAAARKLLRGQVPILNAFLVALRAG
jgi:predicted NUDIX family NTP pyrophosphohydrolase